MSATFLLLLGVQKSTLQCLGLEGPLIQLGPLLFAKLCRELPGVRIMLILGH